MTPDISPAPAERAALIVDDHPIARLGCVGLLRGAGWTRIEEATEPSQAYRKAEAAPPDLIILDVGLPGVGGLKMIPHLLSRAPGAAILMFSMNEQPVFAARALEAGALGYLSKNSAPETFLEAVETVLRGRRWLAPEAAEALKAMGARAEDPLANLTEREHQMLRLIAQGKDLGAVADAVNVSYKTAANASTALKRKLGAKTMTDLVRIAMEQGIR